MHRNLFEDIRHEYRGVWVQTSSKFVDIAKKDLFEMGVYF